MPITKQYLESIQQLKRQFHIQKEFPSLILHSFWTPEEYKKIQTKIKNIHYTHQSIPTRSSYSTAQPTLELQSIIFSSELRSFLGTILNSKNLKIQLQAYAFGWKDYTLLHDDELQHSSTEFIIDFTENWNQSWGGNSILVNGSGDYYPLAFRGNTMVLFHRKKNGAVLPNMSIIMRKKRKESSCTEQYKRKTYNTLLPSASIMPKVHTRKKRRSRIRSHLNGKNTLATRRKK